MGGTITAHPGIWIRLRKRSCRLSPGDTRQTVWSHLAQFCRCVRTHAVDARYSSRTWRQSKRSSPKLCRWSCLLAQLYWQFGNWHDALAAYNWGPGNVQRALKQHRAFPSSVEGYVNSVAGKMGGVQIGSINIMQPGASADQIARAIGDEIDSRRRSEIAVHLNELRALYG